ncbi:TrmH family RNA methyltransferase [Alloscardovia criceti]|uniref:TrmH family RNA methyltransferase n=1 Tax=Alloscardovia criceti TaxID=356828 RepID=UPI001FE1268A|nr:RNA methyltransferase [Alloscardovia criceti]
MDNVKASRVRSVAELASHKARKKTGLFLAEGPQSVREALHYASEFIRDIYVVQDFAQSSVLGALVDDAIHQDIYVHAASRAVMDAMSKDCQGILAVVRSESVQFSAHNISLHPGALSAAFWELRDPGNAGTIIRAADASGCAAVILVDECVDITNPKVVRSTAGSLFHIPTVKMSQAEFFDWARENNTIVTAADVYGTEKTPVSAWNHVVDNLDFSKAHTILFGNEARGLNSTTVDRCDQAAVIPLYGKAESLNVAMSASIMLYTFAMRVH